MGLKSDLDIKIFRKTIGILTQALKVRILKFVIEISLILNYPVA